MIEVKEIKFRPKVDEHDYQFKKKHIERFLEDGDKVKATIFFRGREMAHPEIGRRILERLLGDLASVAIAESDAAEGRQPDAHDLSRRRKPAAARRRRRRTEQRRVSEARQRRDATERHAAAEQALMSVRDGEKGEMPKMKTHRGAAKRFKRTKNGKFLRGKAFKQHILSSKSTKRKRGLRGTTTVADVDAPKLERMLPYK